MPITCKGRILNEIDEPWRARLKLSIILMLIWPEDIGFLKVNPTLVIVPNQSPRKRFVSTLTASELSRVAYKEFLIGAYWNGQSALIREPLPPSPGKIDLRHFPQSYTYIKIKMATVTVSAGSGRSYVNIVSCSNFKPLPFNLMASMASLTLKIIGVW